MFPPKSKLNVAVSIYTMTCRYNATQTDGASCLCLGSNERVIAEYTPVATQTSAFCQRESDDAV